MTKQSGRVAICIGVAALFIAVRIQVASAAEPQVAQVTAAGGSVWGIVTDKKDDSFTVKLDNELQPVKYIMPEHADPKLAAVAKTIFTVARVQVTYTNDGSVHKIVNLKRDMSKPKGTVTGEILSVNDFWIEVKPKDGPPDGYSPGGADWKDKAEKLKTLKKGDIVTIKFFSDGERKRIDKLDVAGK